MATRRVRRTAPAKLQPRGEAPSPASPELPRGATLIVATMAAIAFANTLGHGLVWDDPISVRRWLPALATVWDAFFPPRGIPQFPTDYYRPLQLLSYRLDRAIGGGDPWAFHFSVVVWHVLTSVLVLHVGQRLFRKEPYAAVATLTAAVLFAVHPIHSESVAWMAARPDVMVAGLGLASMLVFAHRGWSASRPFKKTRLLRDAPPRLLCTNGLIPGSVHPEKAPGAVSEEPSVSQPPAGAGLILAMLLLFTALLCKENAVAFFLLLPASLYVTEGPKRPLGMLSAALVFLGMLVVVSAYVGLRTYGLGSLGGSDIEIPPNPLLVLVGAVGTYLRLLLVPYPQNAFIAEVPTHSLSIILSLLFLAGGMALLYRSWKHRDVIVLFLLAWIALTLAPSLLVIFKPPTAPLAERYLYLPSVAYGWLLGLWAARFVGRNPRRLRPLAIGIGAVALGFLGLTVQRNRVWHSNTSLWTDTAAKNPYDGFALRNLAAATLESGDAVAAERLFHAALKLRNTARGQYAIYNNLGSLALNRGDDEAAEKHYRRALELQPGADCVFNLGLVALYRANDTNLPMETRDTQRREARRWLEEAVSASPFDPDVHVALAQAAEGMGDKESARKHFTEALRLGLPAATAAAVRDHLDDLR